MRGLEEVHEDLDFWGFLHLGHHGVVPTPIGDVNVKTLVMTWVIMILAALFTVAATRAMKVNKPGKLQLMVEEMFLFIRGLVYDNIDYRKGAGMVCLLFTLFLFLLFSNLWGLIPTMMSPTADINTTLGMALMVFLLVQVIGLKYKGLSYFKHFLEPVPFFLPLTIIEELSKPITLAFRIYGNIYAGEVLIAVLLGLFSLTVTLMGGFLASVIWLAFSIFVGFIQAFIFTMLTIAYISQQTAEHH
ncbi:ATP synthase F0 sector subunit a [Desulfocucumis palustris]|uniref:ATP synthase subunit a n=1 Tax=Desulfocucumis palustris TaxID=1898651 RepID=A0A2L2XNU2_9FIRM|nr:F0F1 ATP synthase subunit A [Desulfocucumis palustris]GBF35641.1 ATP synthase F0 sector subunit a [Desulfocucumis palustris]